MTRDAVGAQSAAGGAASAQTPEPGRLTVDHVAHFVPDMEQAAIDFAKLGFTLTPFSAQSHRLAPDGPLVAAGTGNRCVMLKRGYIECLTPTGDTPVADQLRAAIARYTGVHLVAFGTATPELEHARLARNGYAPAVPVALQRQITTPEGEDTARFTVVRVPPGTMPEGRIQFCQHHTPELVWQSRWLAHANHADALNAVIVCVDDAGQAARRYGRFTGLEPAGSGENWRVDTQRGRVLLTGAATVKRVFNVAPPRLPWIAGYVLGSARMDITRQTIAASGYAHGGLDRDRLFVVTPSSVGGIVVFEPQPGEPFDLGRAAA